MRAAHIRAPLALRCLASLSSRAVDLVLMLGGLKITTSFVGWPRACPRLQAGVDFRVAQCSCTRMWHVHVMPLCTPVRLPASGREREISPPPERRQQGLGHRARVRRRQPHPPPIEGRPFGCCARRLAYRCVVGFPCTGRCRGAEAALRAAATACRHDDGPERAGGYNFCLSLVMP